MPARSPALPDAHFQTAPSASQCPATFAAPGPGSAQSARTVLRNGNGTGGRPAAPTTEPVTARAGGSPANLAAAHSGKNAGRRTAALPQCPTPTASGGGALHP